MHQFHSQGPSPNSSWGSKKFRFLSFLPGDILFAPDLSLVSGADPWHPPHQDPLEIHGRLSSLQRSAAEGALPVHFSITRCRKCPEFGWRGRAEAHVLGPPTASFPGAQTFAPQQLNYLGSPLPSPVPGPASRHVHCPPLCQAPPPARPLPSPVPGPASSTSTTLSRVWPRLQAHRSPGFGEGGTHEVVFPHGLQVILMRSKA